MDRDSDNPKLQQAIASLARIGMVLGDDTTEDNLLDRLVVAAETYAVTPQESRLRDEEEPRPLVLSMAGGAAGGRMRPRFVDAAGRPPKSVARAIKDWDATVGRGR
jgi:hypothetical protein